MCVRGRDHLRACAHTAPRKLLPFFSLCTRRVHLRVVYKGDFRIGRCRTRARHFWLVDTLFYVYRRVYTCGERVCCLYYLTRLRVASPITARGSRGVGWKQKEEEECAIWLANFLRSDVRAVSRSAECFVDRIGGFCFCFVEDGR